MKVIFLDVDGVLNNGYSFKRDKNNMHPIDPYMVLLVDRIVEATGAKLVLSSSWRFMPEGIDVLKESAPVLKFIGKTGQCLDCRGLEIQEYLDTHDVEKYAILDDNGGMLDSQQESFFQTYFQEGLTDEIAENVIQYLGRCKS